MIYVDNDSLDNLIEKGNVVVDFFATWCGPCKMLQNELEEISLQRDENTLKIVKVDVDRNPSLTRSYGIMSVPTLIYFKDGKIIKQQSGFVPKEVILDAFKNM